MPRRTLDGLGILANQAAIGIALWTGVDVDPSAMRRKLEDLLG
jgi:shikimate 5-dehydrogenase